MGLDMYLSKETYVGAKFEHNQVKGTLEISANGKPLKIDLNKASRIIEEVGYWRKANAIHKWFVDNVQDGEDECKKHDVSWDQLQCLKALCLEVLETKDATKLPPQEGFFFGSTKLDEYYFQYLKDTIKIIESLDATGDYSYQSSW